MNVLHKREFSDRTAAYREHAKRGIMRMADNGSLIRTEYPNAQSDTSTLKKKKALKELLAVQKL